MQRIENNDEPSLMHLLSICIVLPNAQSTLQVIREKKIILCFICRTRLGRCRLSRDIRYRFAASWDAKPNWMLLLYSASMVDARTHIRSRPCVIVSLISFMLRGPSMYSNALYGMDSFKKISFVASGWWFFFGRFFFLAVRGSVPFG